MSSSSRGSIEMSQVSSWPYSPDDNESVQVWNPKSNLPADWHDNTLNTLRKELPFEVWYSRWSNHPHLENSLYSARFSAFLATVQGFFKTLGAIATQAFIEMKWAFTANTSIALGETYQTERDKNLNYRTLLWRGVQFSKSAMVNPQGIINEIMTAEQEHSHWIGRQSLPEWRGTQI